MTRRPPRLTAGRLSAIVSRPGIDPRRWVVEARVSENEEDIWFDENEGYFAIVEVEHTGERFGARIGTLYGGPGYGLFCPVEPNDRVLVQLVEGSFEAAPTILGKAWSPAQKPPSDAAGEGANVPTSDVLLRVKAGHNLRLRVAGAGAVSIIADGDGDVVLAAEGSGKVKLGTSGLQPATLGTANQNVLNNHETRIAALEASLGGFVTAFGTHTHAITVTGVTPGVGAGTGASSPPAGFTPPAPVPTNAPETRAVDTEVK